MQNSLDFKELIVNLIVFISQPQKIQDMNQSNLDEWFN